MIITENLQENNRLIKELKDEWIVTMAKRMNEMAKEKNDCFCYKVDTDMKTCDCCGGYDGHIFHSYEINTNHLESFLDNGEINYMGDYNLNKWRKIIKKICIE